MVTVTPGPPEVFVQQLSVAVGGLNTHVVPHWTTWFGAQVMAGGTLSTMVTDWLQLVTLLQQSMIIQCRVTTVGQVPLVTVLKMEMVTFVPQQESTAVGGVNDQVVPHGTVMLGGQFTTGGVVSCTTTRWLHTVELFVQQSVAIQNCS